MILIDSHVVIDLLAPDQPWYDWSYDAVTEASLHCRLAINHVVVAEVAPHDDSLDMFLERVGAIGIAVQPLSNEAAFAAGRAFRLYRQRRRPGSAKAVLPDFLIGGHAEALGAGILTRDPRFYRAYFPAVKLITPTEDDE